MTAALVEAKRTLLRRYDVAGMQRALNICFWGRSGSFLLASYLDHHPGVVAMPMIASQSIYPFFDEHPSLSLWDKLLAYPAYSETKCGAEGSIFGGEFPIDEREYGAAVEAMRLEFQDRSADWLGSSQRFMQCVHVAHALALGREPATPRPLIVYAQHWCDDAMATRFVADFPDGQFIHTVRDPISSVDSWFDRQLELQTRFNPRFSTHYIDPAVSTVLDLFGWDRAHRGMAARTRAIRFEDLHLAPEATMRALAAWSGLTYDPILLESTFNGRPYAYSNGATTWVGPNPANTKRRSRNLTRTDRALIFATVQEEFEHWNYPCEPLWQRKWVRVLTILGLIWIPMRIEWINSRVIWREQVTAAWKSGRRLYAARAPLYLISRRVRMMVLIVSEAWAHLSGRRRLLRLLEPAPTDSGSLRY